MHNNFKKQLGRKVNKVEHELEDYYKNLSDKDKRQYRSELYVSYLASFLMLYCKQKKLEGFDDLNKSEYHKTKCKELLDKLTNFAKETPEVQLIDSLESNGDFVWEEYISEYNQNYDGLTGHPTSYMTKEELHEIKIEIDNVIDKGCTHEATAEKIEQDQILYLMSRGMSYDQAEQVIVNHRRYGLFEGLIDQLPDV
jgi:hypothetical protein